MPDLTLPPYSKNNPFPAHMLENRLLNGAGSAKETRHHVIDLRCSGLSYSVGDSLGVFASNRPTEVAELLEKFCAAGTEMVELPRGAGRVSLYEALLSHISLAAPSKKLLTAVAAGASSAGDRLEAERLLGLDAPVLREWLEVRHLLDLMDAFPSMVWDPALIVAESRKLVPRLYSIASSPRMYPDQVHLTVAVVRFESLGRERVGVCSSFLADRVALETGTVPVFVAPSHFGLPEDPAADVIMVGPGTGVAPFRAFLQERVATGAPGRNWLFFGDQHEATDFLYAEEFREWAAKGALARLDCAWSRDQKHKIYVQDKIRENAAELYAWLMAGAYFYVCGDAKRMAKDVDQALHDLFSTEGGLSAEEAAAAVKRMKKEGRYQRDVY
ncbi:MAG: sulfite reductase subunit alpha [Opitutales bacterium]|nr:sulfite reductase subunit alpha [Opitutales bacterium]